LGTRPCVVKTWRKITSRVVLTRADISSAAADNSTRFFGRYSPTKKCKSVTAPVSFIYAGLLRANMRLALRLLILIKGSTNKTFDRRRDMTNRGGANLDQETMRYQSRVAGYGISMISVFSGAVRLNS